MDLSIISDRSFGNKQSTFCRTLPLKTPVLFGSKMLVKPKRGCIHPSVCPKSDNDSQEMLFWMNNEGRSPENELDFTTDLTGNSSPKPSDTHIIFKSSGFTTPSVFSRVPNNLFSNICGTSFLSGHFQGATVYDFRCVTDSLPISRSLSFDQVEPSIPADHCQKLSSRLISAFEPTVPSFTSLCSSEVSIVPDALCSNMPLSLENPLSLNPCEELKAAYFQKCIEHQDSTIHLHPDSMPPSNSMSCLKQPKATVGCKSDICEANCDVTSFSQNSKIVCASKVRFLCKKKNSINVKHRYPKKINFRKRCVFRMHTSGEVTVVSNNPRGFHTADLSSCFLQSSESEVFDSSSSDHEDFDDGASMFQLFDAGRMFKHQYKDTAAGLDMYSTSQRRFRLPDDLPSEAGKKKKFCCNGNQKTNPSKESNISEPESDLSDDEEDGYEIDGIVFQSDMNITYNKNGALHSSETKLCVVNSLKDVNARWRKFYESSSTSFPADSSLTRHPKLVQFSDEITLVTVMYEFEWADDYAAARRGAWVEDRMRFDRRIKDTENLIGWVFCPSHRIKFVSPHANC